MNMFQLSSIPLILVSSASVALAGPCGPDTMHIAGTATEWEPTPMLCEDGVWKSTQTFAENGQFKLTVESNWAENYGDNAPRDGVTDINGANIIIEAAGTYQITFDYTQMTYLVSPVSNEDDTETSACNIDSMNLRGSFNDWDNQAMDCTDGAWTADFAATDNTLLKFDVYGDWSENYGDNAPSDGTAELSGDNIVIHDAGNYSVAFNYADKTFLFVKNEDDAGNGEDTDDGDDADNGDDNNTDDGADDTNCVTESMTVRGTFNEWDASPMACNDGVWELVVTTDVNAIIKFDTAGDWVENYGDNLPADGIADLEGSNIMIADAGTYKILFNASDLTYLIEGIDGDDSGDNGDDTDNGDNGGDDNNGDDQVDNSACGADQMSIRGTFNDWEDMAMTCVFDSWQADVNFAEPGNFKFDVFGDWSENYGDNNADNTADAEGDNIQVAEAGSYTVVFDYADLSYNVVKTNNGDNGGDDNDSDTGGDNGDDSDNGNDNVAVCGSEAMSIRGTFNAWEAKAMVCENGIWTSTVDADNNTLLKFDVTGDWSENYGDNGPDGTIDQSGGNIIIIDAGAYTVDFDYINLTYLIAPVSDDSGDNGDDNGDDNNVADCDVETMNLRGSFNDWAVQPMECNDNIWTTLATVEANTLVKFAAGDDWSENYGDNQPGDGVVDANGDNIIINDAGTYLFTFNYATGAYVLEMQGGDDNDDGEEGNDSDNESCDGSLYFRGTANEWAAEEMDCVVGKFTFVATFADGGAFKLDRTGDWSDNYGDNQPRDGVLDQGGANIAIDTAGEYIIEVDFATAVYLITPAEEGDDEVEGDENDGSDEVEATDCGSDTMYLRGSFNDWSTGTVMTCTDSVFTAEVEAGANSLLKFDALGDWSENYGDNAPSDGATDLGGDNIVINDAGTYRINFDYVNKTYLIESL